MTDSPLEIPTGRAAAEAVIDHLRSLPGQYADFTYEEVPEWADDGRVDRLSVRLVQGLPGHDSTIACPVWPESTAAEIYRLLAWDCDRLRRHLADLEAMGSTRN